MTETESAALEVKPLSIYILYKSCRELAILVRNWKWEMSDIQYVKTVEA